MDRMRIGVAGCGSVSEYYLADLKDCPFAEVVAVCDIVEDRFRRRMAELGIPRGFGSVDGLLSGADFDLLLNLTSMQEHYAINKKALSAGKHVFCEKPFAPTYEQGKELLNSAEGGGRRLWAAPITTASPQLRYMADILSTGEIGRVRAAHACYGHGGPSWGPWFYKTGGGSIFDLAVYNITTLTGLLGPAREVTALVGTAVAERVIEGETVRVTTDDNAMMLLDHGDSVFSHIQTGFVYAAPPADRTIELVGDHGSMSLLGWDWEPHGVEVKHEAEDVCRTCRTRPEGYRWQGGAALAADCLIRGDSETTLPSLRHSLHVVEIMEAAKTSARTGRRIAIQSRFPWPLFQDGGDSMCQA